MSPKSEYHETSMKLKIVDGNLETILYGLMVTIFNQIKMHLDGNALMVVIRIF